DPQRSEASHRAGQSTCAIRDDKNHWWARQPWRSLVGALVPSVRRLTQTPPHLNEFQSTRNTAAAFREFESNREVVDNFQSTLGTISAMPRPSRLRCGRIDFSDHRF